MQIYCLYEANASGQFRRLFEHKAPDELSAISQAETRRKTKAMQLWSKGKLVKEWPAIETVNPK